MCFVFVITLCFPSDHVGNSQYIEFNNERCPTSAFPLALAYGRRYLFFFSM